MYAAALGAEQYDTKADSWLADDLADAYVIPGGYLLDPLGATMAMAEAARRAGAELRPGCVAARILV
jgi:glycine/D-amino acid oxidase-like deaminating enzyme